MRGAFPSYSGNRRKINWKLIQQIFLHLVGNGNFTIQFLAYRYKYSFLYEGVHFLPYFESSPCSLFDKSMYLFLN